jgi:hypothetical protein
MIRRTATKLLITLGFLLSQSAMAATKEMRLKPSSKWAINYANENCRLGRFFGEGENQVILFMDRYSPSDNFRVTLSGKPMKSMLGGEKIRIQFGPNETEQKLEYLPGSIDKETPSLIVQSSITVVGQTAEEIKQYEIAMKSKDYEVMKREPIAPARYAAIKSISISKSQSKMIVLETGSMEKPMAALSKCIDDLVTTWGVDVARHAALSRPAMPKGNPGSWLTTDDYPRNMLNTGQGGIVNFRLSIDDTGKPTACHIQETFRERGFDKIVCDNIMKRARFEPALDKDKLPIASFYLNTVRFQIPTL